jgi:peptidoglycan/LPS O-acetylase OafA/YrhL
MVVWTRYITLRARSTTIKIDGRSFPNPKGNSSLKTYSTKPALTQSSVGTTLVERRLDSLDGWRGVAILLVFVRHYFLTSHVHLRIIQATEWVASAGWVGVDLFFVLSGFLITGILLDTRGHKHYFRNFYARRTLRIFPLYYGVLLLSLAPTKLLHLQWQRGDIVHFLYVGNIAIQFNPALDGVKPWLNFDALWSLAVEEQFYLVWPLMVLFIANRKALRWIAAFMGAALLIRIALIVLLPPGHAFEWNYKVLPMRADALLCGAAAAILVRAGTLEEAVQRFRWPAWIAAIGIAAILIQDRRLEFHSNLSSAIVFPCLGILFACLLLVALQNGSWAYRIGRTPWLRFFGRYSYGIYIFHLLVDTTFLMRWLQNRTHSQALGGILYVISILILTTAVAVLSYELYERHFLKLKSRFSYSAELAEPRGPQ